MSKQVGGELFKVPRYHLEKGSSFFRHLLAPRIELAGSDGRDDEQPIRLDEIVTVTEFETFLDMLYPPLVPSKSMRSQEEWAAILKLSTLWRFLEIRQLAIQTLTLMNLTAFTRIKLARDHFVAQWLRTGYADLVKQVNTMTVDEVESVGYLTAIRIFRVREEMIKKHWSASSRDPSFSTSQWDNEEVRKAVEGEFVGEMVDADKRTATYKIDQIKPNRPKNAGKRGPKPGFISRPE
ncbi:hypothetical protein D9758_006329 [Tetrapyrgos nigripes]|uniref:BTB domain-containing protein n=1 Tax=Tetrapyrgos nigripes TaxID=182062 RepID=A0A8H5D8F1_9AGAR|nr:hypothetical protein D9758_006329 [Tetrapyrgos nigripes]